MTVERRFLRSFQSIRGLAALWIVLYHAYWPHSLYRVNAIRNAYLGPDIFFALSGFVISFVYAPQIRSRAEAGRFMVARLIRLYPVHLILLMVFVAIEGLRFVFQQLTGHVETDPAFAHNTAGALFANLALLQATGVLRFPVFNAVSWTISAEFWAYLAFAVTVLCVPARKRWLAAFTLVLASAGLLAWLGYRNLNVSVQHALPRALMSFFMGMLTREVCDWIRPASRQTASVFQVLTSAAVLVFVTMDRHGTYDFFAVLLFPALLLSFAVDDDAPLARALQNRPLLWLGRISYSLYMTQFLAYWLVMEFSVKVLGFKMTVVDGALIVGAPLLWANLLLVAYLICLAGLAMTVFYGVEVPSHARARAFVAGKRSFHDRP